MRANFRPQAVIAACRKYGPLLRMPAGIDGIFLAIAIASNESTIGVNCGPRHESSYDCIGGVEGWAYKNSPQVRAAVAQWGSLGASSFGPWQLMFVNCPGFTPSELMQDLDKCARAFVAHFNSPDVQRFTPETVTDIGQIWNGGHKVIAPKVPSPGVAAYCVKLEKAYEDAQQRLDV